ncbi:GlxA family transcriptional regulator [Williamsia deligens]|uniref:GlxA family transcriptional regulator n=1 Tax=Williamsia deligens TaxID=321325 RepID=A0ABW3G8K6_9NOCA|nr:helix-turn-helix domain-containing protein [Williamsia deligens]MCP2192434.1 Transcriptional regulator GlxA family, contains an amidase domain and an AraC-type DNA-binding HTH domain [Williamsia deligens]
MAHRVVVLLLPPVVGFDATIAPMVFGYAEGPAGTPLYDVVLCSPDGQTVPTTTGYGIHPVAGLEALADADTLIIPGTRYAPARHEGTLAPEVMTALGTVPSHTRWVSICTGAFALAATGRLDGRRATTHWATAEEFRRLYPQVRLDEAVLFVDDDGTFTSAGLAAGVDLCLHLLRMDHGTAVANAVARQCVVPPWREGGQAQFISPSIPDCAETSTTSTRSWILEHLTEPLTIARLAAHAHMSERTFSRRFAIETGTSPGEWIRDRRVDRARELLEDGLTPIDEVARQSGLGSADNLRHHLRAGLGMSPTAYRKTFAGRA